MKLTAFFRSIMFFVVLATAGIAWAQRDINITVAGNQITGTGTAAIALVAQGDEAGVGFSVTFDPAVLRYDSFSNGSGLSGATINVNAAQAVQGRIGVALLLPAGTTFTAGGKQLVVLNFTVLATSATGTTLGFGNQPVGQEISDALAGTLSSTFNGATITASPASTAPSITTPPSSQTVNAKQTVTFTVQATGNPAPTFQWRRNGVNLTNGGNISGATTATLTLTNVSALDAANSSGYDVVASNGVGAPATSSAATLTVNKLTQTISFGALADKLTTGAPFTLGATASSALSVGYSVVSGPATVSGNTVTLTGATGTVTVRATQSGDDYYSAASSVDQSFAVAAAQVAPAITTPPSSQTVNAKQTVTFTVQATGNPAPTFQWRRNGVNLTNGGNISGATTATLTLANVSVLDAANSSGYDVVASNGVGVSATSSAATLTVNKLAQTISFGAIADKLTTAAPIALGATASSGLPVGYSVVSGPATVSVATLTLTGVEGTVTVRATQLGDDYYLAAAPVDQTFAVSAPLGAPAYAIQPVSVIVSAGATATFSVLPVGNPTPTLQWKKNGNPITGATQSTLTLLNVTVADIGTYTCEASNSVQSNVASNAVTLSIKPSVTINQAADQADPSSAGTIHFTVVFDQNVTEFNTGDVTLGGTAGATTAIVTGSGATYTVAVSGMAQNGTVTAGIAAGVARDAVGNTNHASTSTDATVSYSAPVALVPTVRTLEASGIGSGSATLNGTVDAGSGGSILARGFVYAGTDQPTIDRGWLVLSPAGTGAFNAAIEHLSPDSTYYFRAFAVNAHGVSYGDTVVLKSLLQGEVDVVLENLDFADGAMPQGWTESPADYGNRDFNGQRMNAYKTDSLFRIYKQLQLDGSASRLKITYSGNIADGMWGGGSSVYLSRGSAPRMDLMHGWGDVTGGASGTEMGGILYVGETLAHLERMPKAFGEFRYSIIVTDGQVEHKGLRINGDLLFSYVSPVPGMTVASIDRVDLGLYQTVLDPLWMDDVVITVTKQGSPASARTVDTPVIRTLMGDQATQVGISISCATPGALIYYTTDGSLPTTESRLYSGTFTVSDAGQVRAIAVKEGLLNSVYVNQMVAGTPTAGTPAISPNGGSYTGSIDVAFASSTFGSSIYYTTDGTVPTKTSTLYTGPFTLNTSGVVKAISSRSGYLDSPVFVSGEFSIMPAPSKVVNISVRSVARSKASPLIMGFVVKNGAKQLLMRAWGPTLAGFGVAGTLKDPEIELHDDIANGGSVLSANDNWGSNDVTTMNSAFTNTQAYNFVDPTSKDAALLSSVSGLRTLYAFDKNNESGVTLLELYDADVGTASRLVNVSARNYVGVGDEILVLGFSIKGTTSKKLLIRGVGPTLSRAPFNLPNMVTDPLLKLFHIVNGVSTQVDSNDDWASGGVSVIRSAFTKTEAFELPDDTSKDAVLLITIAPGLYTVELHSKTGIPGDAMIEIYEMD